MNNFFWDWNRGIVDYFFREDSKEGPTIIPILLKRIGHGGFCRGKCV